MTCASPHSCLLADLIFLLAPGHPIVLDSLKHQAETPSSRTSPDVLTFA